MRGLALYLMLLPAVSLSQTVTFRSGEHPDFSRLVISIPEETVWSLEPVTEGYALRLGPVILNYDLSGAFEKIPRDRLRDLIVEDDQLLLELACSDCHATAFLWRADRLVVDIIDGPPPIDSPFENTTGNEPAVRPSEALVLRPVNIGDRVIVVTGQELNSGSLSTEQQVEPQVNQSAEIPENTETPDARTASLPSLPGQDFQQFPLPTVLDELVEVAPRVSEFESALIDGLARAATQGLLTPSTRLPTLSVTDDEIADEPEFSPQLTQGPLLSGLPGIAAQTSIDRVQNEADRQPENATGEVCLDETLVDVSSWGDDRPLHAQLAERHAGLATETGELVEAELLRLAKLYIYFGFGSEAIKVLEKTNRSASQRDLLEVMARIVDDLPQQSFLLVGQEDCPSDVALWAVLASGDNLSGAQAEPTSIMQTLRRLPDPIRGHLGQRLAKIFADFGDPETAEALLIVARGGITGENAHVRRIQAAIADNSGEDTTAIAVLLEISEDSSRMSPEALIRLINLSIEQGQAVSDDVIELTDVMRFEHATNPVTSGALLDAKIRAWMNNGNYQEAIDLVGEAESLPMEVRFDLTNRAVARIVAETTDDEFLGFAFSIVPLINAETENNLSKRLVDLGFHDRAAQLLRADAQQETARERRYLRAEIALARGNYEEVTAILAGMTDDRAQKLLVLALSKGGDHVQALRLAQGAANGEDSLLAWRAEAWPSLVDSPEPSLKQIAQARQNRTITSQSQSAALAPLAERRELLNESAQTRELVANLLDNFAMTEDPILGASN